MSADSMKNAQIQAEAVQGKGGSGSGVQDMGKVKEDLWFAQRDRELIEAMKNKPCGDKCDGKCGDKCGGQTGGCGDCKCKK